MTTKLVTALLAGALLIDSAAATPNSEGCHSRTEFTASGSSPVLVVVPPVRPFAARAAVFTQRAPHIIFLKPLTPHIQ
jgi:hypothetical protein